MVSVRRIIWKKEVGVERVMVGFDRYDETEEGCWGGKGDGWFQYVR